jgi:3alpha(or 20beta)-hydroxysteroid dehydrogenase
MVVAKARRLEGRVAVVTGGASGQGAATCRLFASEGARVVAADIDVSAGEALAAELGDSSMFVRLDVSDEAGWEALAEQVMARWATIDVLINNAGMVNVAALIDFTRADFQRTLDINLVGPWVGIKTVAPIMIVQRRGSIVNVCSTAALWSMNGTGAYTASKWALRGLSKTAAQELGWQGVRVNSVYPGGINTPFANIGNKPVEEVNKLYLGQTIQRIGEPEEVAEANLFLASDASSYMCGAELTVNGGMTLGVFHHYLPGAPPEPDPSL